MFLSNQAKSLVAELLDINSTNLVNQIQQSTFSAKLFWDFLLILKHVQAVSLSFQKV
jgi:hypothetical protein